MSSGLALPKITHSRCPQGEARDLLVRGRSRGSTGRTSRSITANPDLTEGGRSGTTREKAMAALLDQVSEKISTKLRGPNYYIIRHSFKAFDPQGQGTVTRQALFRIFYNHRLLEHHGLFQALLDRIGLGDRPVISFAEFYSKFCDRPQSCPHWLDPVTRHSPRTMTANQITEFLKERAKQKLLLSDIFPFPRGPPQQILKPEFMNMINSLGLQTSEEEFDKLWKRMDTDGSGSVSTERFLQKLGVSFGQWQCSTPPLKACQAATPLGDSTSPTQGGGFGLGDNDYSMIYKKLRKCLHGNWAAVLMSLKEMDTGCTGKVTVEDLRRVLHGYGIQATPGHMTELMQRLGMRDTIMIPYKEFLMIFMDCSHGSITDSILQSSELKSSLQPGRVCTSVGDIEHRLIAVLQGKFLKLVSAFKSHDPRGCGLLRRETFISCIQDVLGQVVPLEDALVETIGEYEPGWIAYPKFLSKFEVSHSEGCPPATAPVRPHPQLTTPTAVLSKLQKVVRTNPQLIYQILEDIDEANTGKIQQNDFERLLERVGIAASKDEVVGLWSTIIKDKFNCADHHEFIRHFMGAQTVPILPARHWSEDHCFQRSLKLHRDEDMVIGKLKANLRYYYPSVVGHFRKHDSDNSGLVPANVFKTMMLKLSPELTDQEVINIVKKFTKEDQDMVDYTMFLAPFHPKDKLYRTGYDMLRILGHHNMDVLVNPTIPPQNEQPGPVAVLRQKIGKNWRHLQRVLRRLDPDQLGQVQAKVFFSALHTCGILISPQEQTAIHEAMDPLLTDKIDYSNFLKAFIK